MDAQKIVNESQSSIELGRTTRGYTWKIKIYNFDVDMIVPQLKEKDAELRKEYAPDLEAE